MHMAGDVMVAECGFERDQGFVRASHFENLSNCTENSIFYKARNIAI